MREHMQIIFQDPYSSLNPRMTVGEILEEPFVIHKMGDGGERRKSVLALRSHGRTHPIGNLMTEAERSAAADYLVARIRHARAAAA